MKITTKKQGIILIWIGAAMAVLGAFMRFLTDFDGLFLIVGALLLYEAIVRSEIGHQIFPNPVTFLPKNKFLQWIFVLSGIVITVNSVLEIGEFLLAG